MIDSKYKYHVFISHNKAQKPLVRQIVSQWRLLGLNVFFDEENIQPGQYVVSALSRGVEDSRYIVLMITPEAMAGQWLVMECCSAVQEDPDSEKRRLIPVLLEPTPLNDIPLYIKTRNYLDFTDPQTRRDRYRSLLKYLGIEEDRLPDDLPPVDGVVPPGLTPRQEYLADAMARKRRSARATPRQVRRSRIDRDVVLLDFDLKDQIASLSCHLGEEGVFAFLLAGDYTILAMYVIKRFLRHMRVERRRDLDMREIHLTAYDLEGVETNAGIICRRIAEEYQVDRLADLLSGTAQRSDYLLIIWNEGIPPARLQPITQAFDQEVRRELLPLIRDHSRLFIVFWAHPDAAVSGPFQVIPPIRFNHSEVIQWFRYRLSLEGVPNDHIEGGIKRLQEKLPGTRDIPRAIYLLMTEVLNEL